MDKPPRAAGFTWKLAQDGMFACALSVLLLGLCYLRLWGDSQSAAFDLETIDPRLLRISGTALGANLLLFATAQLVLHLTVGGLCLGAASISHHAWRLAQVTRRHWLFLWFITTTLWLLVANATWFPQSTMGATYAHLAGSAWHGVRLLEVVTTAVSALILVTSIRALLRGGIARPAPLAASIILLLLPLTALLLPIKVQPSSPDRDPGRPNVILLGMDSLRVDALGKGNTPSIDRFLGESVVFTDALTPIARTFPAWVSIITGRHPHTTGAIANLMPRHLIDTGETLPEMLRHAGYSSLYAIDESRFSNLDATFGFDQVVTPPMGASDFVLSLLSDTPLSNVVTNTVVGRLLLPYTYANRGTALTYDPNTFLEQIEAKVPERGPLLLATHLTLAHIPYTWSDQHSVPRLPDGSFEAPALYARAVARLDQQFAAFFAMLERQGRLDNAIVFVFSDHGESLGEPCIAMPGETPVRSSAPPDCKLRGHGTSVFSRDQYQVVLGVRTFGASRSADVGASRVSVPASLEDITPTIVELLELSPPVLVDGESLAPLLRATPVDTSRMRNRIRFVETEFNPPGFSGGAILSEATMRQASAYYQVDPVTDRITLRESEIPGIFLVRQRGAVKDGNMLVADPRPAGTFELLYADRDGVPTQLNDRLSLATDPVLRQLWDALEHRFPELSGAVVFGDQAEPDKVVAGAPALGKH